MTGFFRRFSAGELPLSRLEAFSDGVFAIIVTLLVLDLRVPELYNPKDAVELCHDLLGLLPKFFSWLISFIIVCKFWLNHHYLLRQARHANYAMIWINSIFLMFQSFVPFPTALMGSYPYNPLAVSFFGVIMTFNTLLFIMLKSYITAKLLKPEAAYLLGWRETLKSLTGPLFYLLGALCAWWCVMGAFVFYAITPLFFIVPSPKNVK